MSSTTKNSISYQEHIGSLQPPCVLSLVSDTETPVSVFHRLSAAATSGFLFESAEGDARLARYSFTGVDPLLLVELHNGKAQINGQSVAFDDPTVLLAELIAKCAPVSAGDAELSALPFAGGLVGCMGYGATQYFERIPQQANDPLGVPDGMYGLYDSLVVFDHQYRRLHII
jgi:anthranilate synthase component I